MGIKSIALVASTLVLSTSVNAALIDNGIYTSDSESGLDWLDLTETFNMAYKEIQTGFASGGALEGWRIATTSEVTGFFDANGGDSAYYNMEHMNNTVYASQNAPLYNSLIQLWGCVNSTTCAKHRDQFTFVHASTNNYPDTGVLYQGHFQNGIFESNQSVHLNVSEDRWLYWSSRTSDGSWALVRETSSVVPVPAAVWLFGSGLIGLVGVARKKKS